MSNRINKIIFLLFFVGILSLASTGARSQTIYDQFSQLSKRLQQGRDTVYLINFWATWCKPCVEEMPFFNELETGRFHGTTVKVLLVSLDFKNDFEKKLVPFMKNKNIRHEVILMADPDMNDWIPRVDKNWDGNIPVTWLFQQGRNQQLVNRSIESRKELQEIISRYINDKTSYILSN